MIAARFSLSCLLIDIRLCTPVCTSVIPVRKQRQKERSPDSPRKTAGPLAFHQSQLDSTHDKILREPWPGALPGP